ncbi:hypothetical protein MSG28_002173 [Choristoneura fumiferana]|uniref:Uncharacterized protein n=1 Tax=Choristoneura fumiferana TaxID=7141 RepID=A0ACC0JU65_CHOFU|nr:hypothetical protein MSG28_002173 [Choristoneura fumiferana]
MLCRVFSLSRKLYATSSISKTRTMNIEKCYFRLNKLEDKVDLTFLLKVKETVRQFNFSRKPTESIENLRTRIGANVQKVVKKGIKKNSSCELQEVEVRFINGNNEHLPDTINCSDLFSLQEPLKLQVLDHFYEVVFNVPWIDSVSLPQSILSGFAVYPEHFTSQNTKKNECVFNWYTGVVQNDKGNKLSEIHIQWELVGCSHKYVPSVHDIGKKLKLECIPENGTTRGPAVEAISKNVVEAGPGNCPFETRHMFTTTKLTGKSFRCVTYNILADLYCDSDFTRTVLYPYCPPYALHIDYRKQLIMKELSGYNADIICLQEVDTKIFKSCLDPLLRCEGYKGLFYKKGKEVAEGLACFFREDRFEVLAEDHIVLSKALTTHPDLKPIWDAVQCNEQLKERILDRSTVASATFLKSHDSPNEILIVGNTHLYFHPDADHIRLLQGGMVIYWLQQIRNSLINKVPDKRVSLVLCGDFNSTVEAVLNLSLKQEIIMGSACGTPQYTNFTAGFADCLDYIYYEKANIEIEQVIPLPSIEELQAHTALPSIVFPSDHIALVSDLRFIPKTA